MRFPLAGWAWPSGPRVAAAHDSGVDGRDDGREKGPMQTTSGPQRDKTRPAARLDGINRYKTLPARAKTLISAHFLRAGRTFYRFRHQQPEQGELYPACRAASGTKLSPLAASAGDTGRKLSQHTSSYRNSAKKFAQHPTSRADPRKSSPSRPQNAIFGAFIVRWANFFALTPAPVRAGRKYSRANIPPHPSNAPLSKFRMQFDCVNFQQSPETLQFQRYEFKV